MNHIIRKTEDTLITVGSGVMLFGAWTFLKFLLGYFVFGAQIDESQPLPVKVIFIIIVWTVSMIDGGVRVYIGYAARCEGMRRKRLPYLILTGILLAFYLLALVLEAILLFTVPQEVLYMLMVLLIDVTSMLFLWQLLINSVRIRRFRKQYTQNGEPNER